MTTPILFSAQYRRIIKDRTQCNIYRFGDTGASCVGVDDQSKDAIPGKKQTKVSRLVDLVRHSRGGKTFYGDAPELNIYAAPPMPIIDGLRGGFVPASMRKNKF
jgi:hypothetical protein